MSYAAVPRPRRPTQLRPLARARFGPGLKGFGTVMDGDVLTSAWYCSLIQNTDASGGFTYQWATPQYLSNWDAMSYNANFTSYNVGSSQVATLYQWDDGTQQWLKTGVA